MACAFAVGLKFRLGYDDSLDVVGVHLVGGLVGTLAVGFLATDAAPVNTVNGLFYGGGLDQLWRQALGAVAVLVYSFVVTWVIAKAIDATMGFRASDEDELQGVDQTQHAETGYDLTPIAIGRRPGATGPLGDAIGATSHWGQGTRTTEDVNS